MSVDSCLNRIPSLALFWFSLIRPPVSVVSPPVGRRTLLWLYQIWIGKRLHLPKVLHLDDADEASVQAAKWAKAAGVTVVLDGTWHSEVLTAAITSVSRYSYRIRSFCTRLDARCAARSSVVEGLYEFGARIAVVTLGERGSCGKMGGRPPHASSLSR